MSLAHVSATYASLLSPIPPFTWLGSTVSTLDVLAVIRLCAVMRQIREAIHHGQDIRADERSFVKYFGATFTVVYGGEALSAAWLGQPPSFIVSGAFPLLYLGGQIFIESLPWIPPAGFELEAPLTFLDALTRSYLLTNLIPPSVLTHSNPALANSPWTLLLVSCITANGGFFIVNIFSMMNSGGWSVATPPEFKAYGWTTVDLWAAPLITGLVALLTHAQPFWTYLHLVLAGLFRAIDAQSLENNPVKPWSMEDARSLGAVVLWFLFATRTVNNLGLVWWNTRPKKKEVMRSRIDGRRYPGVSKTKKTQ